MEHQIKFVQVTAENDQMCKTFETLMLSYIAEMNEHSHRPLPEPFQRKWISSIIAMQGPSDRHLELCYDGEALVGFLYGKIDHEDHMGFIKPGYGYIMEFFVLPEYRRKGYGKAMFRRLERHFRSHGATRMYLTPDPVSGAPFWSTMGFANTGAQSPENQLDIYEKAVTPLSFESCTLRPLTEATAAEISQWEHESPFDVYNFKGRPNGYLMDKSTWGTEQFCLMDDETVVGQVACQYEGDSLWVGWSMNPVMVGKHCGCTFVRKCVEEIRRTKNHTGRFLLRVAAWNMRAIKAYQKVGFTYLETIQDEIAYTNHMEDFWVMVLTP